MKLKAISLTVMAAAAAALVAACGGGGGSGAGVSTPAGVQLSGVAATGLALANSNVDVKCASGTGSATTNDAGSYTVTVENGALPCIVKVTGTSNGVAVTLHSLAEGTGTTATANVTPLTELILARAAGMTPAALFAAGVASVPTGTALSQATTDVLASMGTAANIDLSGVDPFKGALVAATAANLEGGNGYDQLLDKLALVVSPAMLPQVVSQVASTAGGTSAPVTLEQVVANVQAGSLAGCPQALSGKYRVIDYDGGVGEVELNFGTMKVNAEVPIDMVRSETQACEVTVQDQAHNDNGPTTIVFGPSGAGAVRDNRAIAYIFPLQSHTLASVAGKWEFMESGLNESSRGEHWVGEMDIAADGKVTVCDYEVFRETDGVQVNNFTECVVDTADVASLSQSGSTLLLNYGDSTSPVYGFRAPNGALTLFGANHTAAGLRTSFVLTQPQTVSTQPVGSEQKFWDVVQFYRPPAGSPAGTPSELSASVPGRNATVVTESTETTVTRKLTSSGTDNGRIDTLKLNDPIPGLRSREQGPSNLAGQTISAVYIRNLPGLGMAVAIDGMAGPHFLSLSVGRP